MANGHGFALQRQLAPPATYTLQDAVDSQVFFLDAVNELLICSCRIDPDVLGSRAEIRNLSYLLLHI